MRALSRFGLPVVVVVVVVAVAAGCSYTLTRAEDIVPGGVSGRTVDERGDVIPYATVAIDGTPVRVRSLNDGTFTLRGLGAGTHALGFRLDVDGDGVADRAAFRAVRIVELDDGTLSGVLMGDVRLDSTVELPGKVVAEDGSAVPGAQVTAHRDTGALDVVGGLEDEPARALAVEAQVLADETGAFVLRGVAPGSVSLAAFDALPAARASEAVVVEARAGADEVTLALGPFGPRAATLVLEPPPSSGTVDVDVVERGAGSPDNPVVEVSGEAAPSVALETPVGVWDVFTSAGDRSGVLFDRVVPAGESALLWGPLLLRGGNPCGDVDDRDGDGRPALPAPAGANDPVWVACAATCAERFPAGDATCDVGGTVYDCDDDDDDQPDVTEPFSCVSLCAGGDRDGDGTCDRADPSPLCADNAPGACDDGEPFDPPPPVYVGEGEGEGEGEIDPGDVNDPLPIALPANVAVDVAGETEDCFAFTLAQAAEIVAIVRDPAGQGCATADVSLTLFSAVGPSAVGSSTDTLALCPALDVLVDPGAYVLCVEQGAPAAVTAVTLDVATRDVGGTAQPEPVDLPVSHFILQLGAGDEDCVSFTLDAPAKLFARDGADANPSCAFGAVAALRILDDAGNVLDGTRSTITGLQFFCDSEAVTLDPGTWRVCATAEDPVEPATFVDLSIGTDDDGALDDPTPFTVNTPLTFTLDGLADVDCFTATTTSAGGLVVNVLDDAEPACSTADPRVHFENAAVGIRQEESAFRVGSSACPLLFVDTAAGAETHTICVEGRSVLPRPMRLEVAQDLDGATVATAAAATLGSTFTASLAFPGDRDCYAFNVPSPTALAIRSTSCAGTQTHGVSLEELAGGVITTVNPDTTSDRGIPVCAGAGAVLPVGTYLACVDSDRDAAVGDVELELAVDSDNFSYSTPLEGFNGRFPGTLDLETPGDVDCIQLFASGAPSVSFMFEAPPSTSGGIHELLVDVHDEVGARIDASFRLAFTFPDGTTRSWLDVTTASTLAIGCVQGPSGLPIGLVDGATNVDADNDLVVTPPNARGLLLGAGDVDCVQVTPANTADVSFVLVDEGGGCVPGTALFAQGSGLSSLATGGRCPSLSMPMAAGFPDSICALGSKIGFSGALLTSVDDAGSTFAPTDVASIDDVPAVLTIDGRGDTDCYRFPVTAGSRLLATARDAGGACSSDVGVALGLFSGPQVVFDDVGGCPVVEVTAIEDGLATVCGTDVSAGAEAGTSVQLAVEVDDLPPFTGPTVGLPFSSAIALVAQGDRDCVRFVPDVTGDVVASLRAAGGECATGRRTVLGAALGAREAVSRPGQCGGVTFGVTAGAPAEVCVTATEGATPTGLSLDIRADADEGRATPLAVTLPFTRAVPMTPAGDTDCFTFDAAGGPVLVATSIAGETTCSGAFAAVTVQGNGRFVESDVGGCPFVETVLGAGPATVCVTSDGAGLPPLDVRIEEGGDIDGAGALATVHPVSAVLVMTSDVDEECLEADVAPGDTEWNAQVTGFAGCATFSLRVEDADTGQPLASNSGFCAVALATPIGATSRVRTCVTSTGGTYPVELALASDVDGESAVRPAGPELFVGGIIEGTTRAGDLDCVRVSADFLTGREIVARSTGVCDASPELFVDGAFGGARNVGEPSFLGCADEKHEYIPRGVGADICVRGLGRGIDRTPWSMALDLDIDTPNGFIGGFPFLGFFSTSARGNDIRCFELSNPADQELVVSLEPSFDEPCDRGASRLFTATSDVFASFTGRCTGGSLFVPAGPVEVCGGIAGEDGRDTSGVLHVEPVPPADPFLAAPVALPWRRTLFLGTPRCVRVDLPAGTPFTVTTESIEPDFDPGCLTANVELSARDGGAPDVVVAQSAGGGCATLEVTAASDSTVVCAVSPDPANGVLTIAP